MNPKADTSLIITDGRLASFLACWTTTLETSPSRTVIATMPIDVGPTARAGTSAQSSISDRIRAVQAPLFMPEHAVTLPAPPAIGTTDDDRNATWSTIETCTTADQSHLLLSAAHVALALELDRIVWPAHFGVDAPESAVPQPHGAPSSTLELIADTFDRAMLIRQLASIDAGRTRAAPRIELPYIDLTDTQLIDLAIDMALPLWACIWCDARPEPGVVCSACPECRRWQAAVARVAPGSSLAKLVKASNHTAKTS